MAKKDKNKNKGNVFQNLMQGRYGGDNYGLFLFVTGLALMIIGAIGNNIPGTILMMIATAEIVFAYVRLMSKKYDKRREENRRYLYKRNSLLGTFKIVWRTLKEGRRYKFYTKSAARQSPFVASFSTCTPRLSQMARAS